MSNSSIEKMLERNISYSSKKIKNNKSIKNRMEKMKKLINLVYDYMPKLEKQPDILGETIHIVDVLHKDFHELYDEYKNRYLKDFIYEACCLHEEYEKTYSKKHTE